MTPETIARLRELLAKATPGDWLRAGSTIPECWQVETGDGDFIAQCEDRRGFTSLDAVANTALIIGARNALPALLDALEAGLKREEALREAIKPILDDLGAPGHDGWTSGYAHVTDLDSLNQALNALTPTPEVG